MMKLEKKWNFMKISIDEMKDTYYYDVRW